MKQVARSSTSLGNAVELTQCSVHMDVESQTDGGATLVQDVHEENGDGQFHHVQVLLLVLVAFCYLFRFFESPHSASCAVSVNKIVFSH